MCSSDHDAHPGDLTNLAARPGDERTLRELARQRHAAVKAVRRTAPFLALVILVAGGLRAGDARAAAGARLDTLVAGGKTYHQVEVRSVNARSLVILHAGGMVSIPLRDLSPDLQERFGYDPEDEQEAEARLREERQAVEERLARRHEASARRREEEAATAFETMLQRLGQSAVPAQEVDLRPRFFQLSLGVKDQGRRPSCAVFAVVSALEYQNAALAGSPEKLSEEYLIWATRKITRRAPLALPGSAGTAPADDDADEGFALPEVVAALRTFGIPLQSAMPNTFGRRMAAIPDPPADVVEEARSRRQVYIHILTGRDPETQVNNIVHALNAGVPVVIGLRWPHYRTLRAGYLSEQKPIDGYAHAVTLVGYASPSRRLDETVFLFKNSYGSRWGQGGYGRVTYAYLTKRLLNAVLVEVQRGSG